MTRRKVLSALTILPVVRAAQGSKHIVLISGDEEYRSEELLPQLAKILSFRHGFKCTVLYALDSDGSINPDRQDNIPGLESLDSADLMVILTRFRNLPDAQMKHIVDYVEAGKPVFGLRTATHGFQLTNSPTYARYSWNQPDGGFGRVVLGETWIAHHGKHGKQSTRGIVNPGQQDHPILRGVTEIWSTTDVYAAKLPLPGDSQTLVLGQVLAGMEPSDAPVDGPVNNPMMPVLWVRHHKGGRVVTTTLGTSMDLLVPGARRLFVNACYWALGMESKIDPQSNVDLVGEYKPLPFGFGKYAKGRRPESPASR